MKFKIIMFALIAMAVSNASTAATTKVSESSSAGAKEGVVVIGTAVAGALLGGPVGYLVGGLTGIWLADKVGKAEQLENNLSGLDEANVRIGALDQELARADSEAETLENKLDSAYAAEARYRELASAYVSFEMMFRTGASDLAPESEQRLTQLARFLAEQPDIDVTLSGYADSRGDDTYNQTLTDGRVQAIASALELHGVEMDRITRQSFGDQYSLAAVGDLDAYALERRVTIELSVPHLDTELASNR